MSKDTSTEQSIAEGKEEIALGTNSFNQRYLYAFATQAEVHHHIRTQTLAEEVERLPQVLEAWQQLQPRIASLIQTESGTADKIGLEEIPKGFEVRIKAIADDELLKKTFWHAQFSFSLVEVDRLVSPQRTVNLDYVEKLKAKFPKDLGLDELIDLCLSPKRAMDPIQHLEVGPNSHVFSSPNSDIRFLCAFLKPLTKDDLGYTVAGGNPVAAVIGFVGYGCASINAIKVDNRVVLNNGFHRVFALRSLGVKTLPMLIQHIANFHLECPPVIAGLPREYLFGYPRPVLIKDFFENDFNVTLKAKERIKMVTVGMVKNEHDIPS